MQANTIKIRDLCMGKSIPRNSIKKNYSVSGNLITLRSSTRNSPPVKQFAFEGYLQRINLEKLEDEKRKRAGGGGSSNRQFDRIAVSMMLSNFLSNKTVLAMITNANSTFDKLNINLENNSNFKSQFHNITFKISNLIVNMTNIFSSTVLKNIQKVTNIFSSSTTQLASIFISQLKKLKEVIEDELSEKINKLNLKEKIKKAKAKIIDCFIEVKENLLSMFELALGKCLTLNTYIKL